MSGYMSILKDNICTFLRQLIDNSGFNFSLKLEGGKRFDLGQYSVANISYAPTIALTLKRYGGDIRDEFFKSSRELAFHFLKFDILFLLAVR